MDMAKVVFDPKWKIRRFGVSSSSSLYCFVTILDVYNAFWDLSLAFLPFDTFLKHHLIVLKVLFLQKNTQMFPLLSGFSEEMLINCLGIYCGIMWISSINCDQSLCDILNPKIINSQINCDPRYLDLLGIGYFTIYSGRAEDQREILSNLYLPTISLDPGSSNLCHCKK